MRKIFQVVPLLVMASLLVAPAANAKISTKGLSKFIHQESEAVDHNGDARGIKVFNRIEGDEAFGYVNGTVTEVSATSISVSVKHRSDANLDTIITTVYTFSVDSLTKVVRKFKGSATIAEVAVGDRVAVWGSDLHNGRARLIWDKSIWWGQIKGTVTDLNTTTKTFKLVLKQENKHGLEVTVAATVKTDDHTKFFMGDTAKAFSDLANDQKVTIRGSWNSVGKYFLANKVTITS